MPYPGLPARNGRCITAFGCAAGALGTVCAGGTPPRRRPARGRAAAGAAQCAHYNGAEAARAGRALSCLQSYTREQGRSALRLGGRRTSLVCPPCMRWRAGCCSPGHRPAAAARVGTNLCCTRLNPKETLPGGRTSWPTGR